MFLACLFFGFALCVSKISNDVILEFIVAMVTWLDELFVPRQTCNYVFCLLLTTFELLFCVPF